ncbi:MAG: S8 family serine peptidase [Ignavibacteria bacterium]|jgi:hypothetical protein|nr:S8 family serine peptidase [Ignavibacteria bacterium]MCU7522252.1 S8 family serine peptidase [Ignavibacteria bacterium]
MQKLSIQLLQKVSLCFLLFLLFFSYSIFAQSKVYSEAPVIFENGVKKSTQITVHFKYPIFSAAKGEKEAFMSNSSLLYPNLIKYFKRLEDKYGKIKFNKAIPSAVWGEFETQNKAAGNGIKVKDMSQLLFIKFNQFVPIDSIIAELSTMDEVLYVHQPIQATNLAEPNDTYYQANQWNLTKINASKAWDISKGDGNVNVGIIDPEGNAYKYHSDLQNKVVTNNEIFGSHATECAGVVGASTNNNGVGIASLGWDLKIKSFDDSVDDLVLLIMNAANDSSIKVINLSWCTLGTQQVEDPSCDVITKYHCFSYFNCSYPEIENAINYAVVTMKKVVVAASGNENPNEYLGNAEWCI